jgi:hypothetical protein
MAMSKQHPTRVLIVARNDRGWTPLTAAVFGASRALGSPRVGFLTHSP